MGDGPTEPRRLTVPLGSRSYEILVGRDLLRDAGQHLGPVLARPKAAIVTDETVAKLHLETLRGALAKTGVASDTIVLPPGEASKNFAELERLLDRLLELDLERNDTLIALGGGVIGDITGFAASVLRRGTGFVQIPTTLLAQVDSAVGGKTGINTRHGKNLIGSFYQPRLVLADVGLLQTLPRRQLLAGYAEVMKYGLLGDREFFAWLEREASHLLDGGNAAVLAQAVLTSCAIKARFVGADEREVGERALLNLGHTFGHALEAASGYDGSLLHGEAVAIGMVLALELSVRLGFCRPEAAARVRQHFVAVGLPTSTGPVSLGRADAAALLAHMRHDKKVRDGQLAFVLLREIGDAFLTREIEPADVIAVLERELAA